MPAPSQLSIATSVVNRLVKEEASYHKELAYQRASIKKLEEGGGDENAEYLLRQEVGRLFSFNHIPNPLCRRRIEAGLLSHPQSSPLTLHRRKEWKKRRPYFLN